MRVFFKYIFWLLSFFTLIIFFIFATKLGSKTLGYFLGEYLSSKTSNIIKVETFNLSNYPQLIIDMKINNGAKVHFEGTANYSSVDMHYHLQGKQYSWNDMVLNTPINIEGQMKGLVTNLKIKGKGKAFDGNITFNFTRIPNKYKNVHLHLSNVQSDTVLKFLKKKPLLRGRADIKSEFKFFSKYEREGNSTIYMKRGFMPSVAPYIPFILHSNIEFKNFLYKFNGNIASDIGSLVIQNAYYHKILKKAEVDYNLNLNELSYFEELSKHQFHGKLNTKGMIHYEDKKFLLKGDTDKFDGKLLYKYKDKKLDLRLENVSLVKMLQQFHYPELLSAKVFGTVEYDIEKKIAIVNTKLRKAHFCETKLTNIISKAIGVNVLAEIYDNSSFVGGYQNERLNSILKIDNGINHFYLTDTILNKATNRINSKFAVLIHGDEVFGEIYGTLDHPSVSVDMRRLLTSQLKKRFSSFLGTSQTEKLKTDIDDLKGNLSKKLGDFFSK